MRHPLALAIVTASMAFVSFAPAHAAAVFPQGPCGGILCGMSSSDTPPAGSPPKTPQNCGGILCDMGTRAFPTAGGPVAAAAPEPAPPPAPECGFVDKMTNSCPPPPPPPPVAQAMPEPEPVTKHKKKKHVAAKRTPAPTETAASADKAN